MLLVMDDVTFEAGLGLGGQMETAAVGAEIGADRNAAGLIGQGLHDRDVANPLPGFLGMLEAAETGLSSTAMGVAVLAVLLALIALCLV